MASVFSKIINGQIPSYKVAENHLFYAFLDIEPLQPGHTLVVPKIEIDKWYDAPDNYLQEALLFSKKIAQAIEKAFTCERCGLSIIGLEVHHMHIHLIPISTAQHINFTQKPQAPTAQELQQAQQQLLAALARV
jgi:histidine triad (HIT) family protein